MVTDNLNAQVLVLTLSDGREVLAIAPAFYDAASDDTQPVVTKIDTTGLLSIECDAFNIIANAIKGDTQT